MKDDNQLILCGIAGVSIIALIIRYHCLLMGFDKFGANCMFIVAMVIGVITFITYIMFIREFIVPSKPDLEQNSFEKSIDLFENDFDSLDVEYIDDETREYPINNFAEDFENDNYQDTKTCYEHDLSEIMKRNIFIIIIVESGK